MLGTIGRPAEQEAQIAKQDSDVLNRGGEGLSGLGGAIRAWARS